MKKICIIMMLSLVCFGCKKKEPDYTNDAKPTETTSAEVKESTQVKHLVMPNGVRDMWIVNVEGYKVLFDGSNKPFQLLDENNKPIKW